MKMDKDDRGVNNKKNNEGKGGVNISTIDIGVFEFGLQGIIDRFMASGFVRGITTLVCLFLALVFGLMFLIGGVNLIKGGKADTESAMTATIEVSEEQGEGTEAPDADIEKSTETSQGEAEED